MDTKISLVYQSEDSVEVAKFVVKMKELFYSKPSISDISFALISIDESLSKDSIDEIKKSEALIFFLSYNLLQLKFIFSSEMEEIRNNIEKKVSILLRPSIWELTYFSNMDIFPKTKSPLSVIDFNFEEHPTIIEELINYFFPFG